MPAEKLTAYSECNCLKSMTKAKAKSSQSAAGLQFKTNSKKA